MKYQRCNHWWKSVRTESHHNVILHASIALQHLREWRNIHLLFCVCHRRPVPHYTRFSLITNQWQIWLQTRLKFFCYLTRKRSIELEESPPAWKRKRRTSLTVPCLWHLLPRGWGYSVLVLPRGKGQGQGGGTLSWSWLGRGQRWGGGTLSWFWLGEWQGGGYPVLVLVVGGVGAPCPGHGRGGVG